MRVTFDFNDASLKIGRAFSTRRNEYFSGDMARQSKITMPV